MQSSAVHVVTVNAPGTASPTVTITPFFSHYQYGASVDDVGHCERYSRCSTSHRRCYANQRRVHCAAVTLDWDDYLFNSGRDAGPWRRYSYSVLHRRRAVRRRFSNGTAWGYFSPLLVAINTPSPVARGNSRPGCGQLFSAGRTHSGTLLLTCALAELSLGRTKPTHLQDESDERHPHPRQYWDQRPQRDHCSIIDLFTSSPGPERSDGVTVKEGVVLAVLLMFGIPSRRRRWTMLKTTLLLMVVGFVAIGCGGGSLIQGTGTVATTAGSYTFTVTGTDSADASLTTSTSVVVTVQ